MEAVEFNIVDKRRESAFAIPHLSDFGLERKGQVSVDEILRNACITLYSLDFDTKTAVFVETPADIDLSQAPFMFVPQYDEALRVLTLSFDEMLQLADGITIKEERLVFIHSTGRCGSTLASQVFAQVPGVVNLSEPFVLPQLVIEKVAHSGQKDELINLFKASVLLLCKTDANTAWVIKEHSYALELADWLYDLFPQAKHLFLYRNTETWMRSCLSAYFGGGAMTTEELLREEAGFRAYKDRLIPSLAILPPEPHLSFAETMTIEWLSYMERHAQFCGMGMEMLAIRYQDWKASPQKTAEAMLDYCRCRPDDMSAVHAILEQDSQGGTMLAQETVTQPWVITDRQRAIMDRILQEHSLVNSADYEAFNSLKL